MMHKLVKQMLEERDDFMGYVFMIKECNDPAIKNELKKIAEEEVKHYKHLHDMVFGKADTKEMSHLEHGLYQYATEEYKEMLELLESIK